MSKQAQQLLDGAALTGLFEAAMINLAGTEISAAEARESEQLATNALGYFAQDGVLNPALIPTDANAEIARASVDAHIKKLQAEQYEALGQSQLADMQEQVKAYVGKKLQITVLDRAKKPISSLWFNAQKGYSANEVDTAGIRGTIEEVWLEKNALLLKPRLSSRIFEPNRKNYIVYVIDPYTMKPMVDIRLA